MSTPSRQTPSPEAPPSFRLITGIALALLIAVASRTAAGGFAAGTTTNFNTAINPRAVVTGDLNNDGIPDMIANGAGGSGVVVYLGTGGGAFTQVPGFNANAGGVPVLGDFNLDGKLDIAIPLSGSPATIQFYNGVGNGSFTSGNSITSVVNAEFLAAGDFNGDGKLDLASCGNTTSTTGTVRVFLNTTTTPGNFEQFSATDVAVGAQPRGIAVATNLFGTNRLDLVTANQSAGSVSLLKNDGTGHFGNRLDVATQKSCYAVTAGMVFYDEVTYDDVRPQIFTANKDSAAVSMVVFNPNTSAWESHKFASAADPRFVSLGDTDGNGNLDVVVSAYNSNMVSILSPVWNGPWFKPHFDVTVGNHPSSASVVNFDGDLKPDLLVCSAGNHTLNWVKGAPKVGWALGDTIPAFAAKTQYDETFTNGSLAGKWTLLDLCSRWCGPCQGMALTTQKTWLNWYHHPSVPFEYVTALDDGDVLGVPSTRDDAMWWAWKFKIFRPILHSSDLPGGGVHAMADDAETSATPTLRLVDPSGRIVWLNLGGAADTTIARVVANAAGVPIPATVDPGFVSATLTVNNGAQQASSPSFYNSFPFTGVSGFGQNLTAEFDMTRSPDHTEQWYTYVWTDSLPYEMPVAKDWQITLSNVQLDPAPRFLPPGTTATVFVQDTDFNVHVLPTPVSVSWNGSTLTYGAIHAADLVGLPPIQMIGLAHTMQFTGWVAGVDDGPLANTLALRTPSPNPARSASRLAWSQPRAGVARLDVFDVSGRHVRTVANGFQAAGVHAESWNLADENGARVGAGLYFLRLAVAGEQAVTQRITVVR